ncbi:MAG: YlmC/YmxH family sporulation protein [Dethiobacter sp.]|nr:YlmC/YmxH family sporulation protein [Dethiobacter sp.]
MEMSRLSRKEIINIYDGARLGYVGESDLVIDSESGIIKAIIIVQKGLGMKMGRSSRELVIPWDSVKKIGEEVLIVDLSPARATRHHE